MPRRPTEAPRDHVVSGEWPEAELDGDPGAAYAQAIARALRDGLRERSIRSIGRDAGVADVTVAAVLSGANHLDIRTLARLEAALNTPLLPGWRKRKPPKRER
jgi:hypothetical protein